MPREKPNNMMKQSTGKNHYLLIEKAYRSLSGDVYAFFRKAGISVKDSEDMTQEVFLKLLSLDFINRGTLQGLIFVTAYHMRVSYFRHRTANVNVNKNATNLFTSSYTYEIHPMEAEELACIEKSIIARMNPTDSIVYSMNRFEGMSSKEISAELCLTIRSVESRLYRTRLLVRGNIRSLLHGRSA